ncbi:MAG: hypothetical protein CMG35_03975 [Candidatus Marinimicrobia bacterium]|nr:hypothetical protein [Candidatus Neomarinimicrobiota bacterium]|tara:strand:- start:15780 stop:17699 length:1920 start_codon:yes stop_codon:yes gene_type:complete
MFLGVLVLLTALTISAVAIYYSVSGLVAIFAAAALPIMIMGGVLEVGKLVTAVWLHRYWAQTKWWLKSYLSLAVILLMFITSMGIFGFLSKAHIEQTSASEESVAQVQRIDTEIARYNAVIDRAEEKIETLETRGTGGQSNIQSQIDIEEERIKTAYERYQPQIEEQQKIIDQQQELYNNQLTQLDDLLGSVQEFIAQGTDSSIKQAQTIIGTRADGNWGSGSARTYRNWVATQEERRQEIISKIEQLANNPTVIAAREEILRLRGLAEKQIEESNRLITSYREQLSSNRTIDVGSLIDAELAKINETNDNIDKLTEEKYALEAEYRKLEAEVGPIKYIAEFVYGEQADKDLLEQAVRWVILLIIFVFDPLAVLLLIASQYTFETIRNKKPKKEVFDWDDYEHKRAQAIVDNPGPEGDKDVNVNEAPDSVDDELAQSSATEEEQAVDKQPEQTESRAEDEASDDSSRAERDIGGQPGTPPLGDDTVYEIAKSTASMTMEPFDGKLAEETVKEQMEAEELVPDVIEPAVNMKIDEEWQEREKPETKKKQESSERLKALEEKENDEEYVAARTKWKAENPDQTLKHYKNLYAKGVIDSLPWEQNTIENKYTREPLTEVIEPEGYSQNSEQNENTLFNKLKK